jgi:hypothetical protein
MEDKGNAYEVASVQYNHYELFWDQQDRWRMKVMHMRWLVYSIITTNHSGINRIDGG